MPWEVWQEFTLDLPIEGMPGKFLRVHGKRLHPSVWVQIVCRFMTKLGDITTAGRRRSWFFEGLYSKTHIGWIGYSLMKDLLLHGKHQKGQYEQYRMTWDRMHATWYRSEF